VINGLCRNCGEGPQSTVDGPQTSY
jgi:hypothetical protein